MARKKQTAKKYRCCFCDHLSILILGAPIGKEFELTSAHKGSEKFMVAFNKALENKVICPL